MAIMAPEVASSIGAGDIAGGIGGGMLGRKGSSDSMGGYGEKGSAAAFMLAIGLLGLSMMLLWAAFHTPADWEANVSQFPGLLKRILMWMDKSATGAGGVSGDPFGTGTTERPVPIPDTGLGAQTGQVAGSAVGGDSSGSSSSGSKGSKATAWRGATPDVTTPPKKPVTRT